MRTTPAENEQLGKILAEKLNRSTGPLTVLLPLRGGSVISAPGGPFHDPEADAALYASLKRELRPDIAVREFDGLINDPAFAQACSESLIANIAKAANQPR
jgi:uncharacterized protein (UPF0261 family)